MFVRAANPIWFFVDLVGLALDDTYYAFFLTNTFPYQPQPPFRDPQGLTVWTGGVVQFYPNGTLPDNLYFDPTLTYRIEIRHGNSQTDPLIDEINNFVPNGGSSNTNTALQILSADNQASNTNFAEILFNSPLTITTAGTYDVAPGWQLTLTGTGTTTLTQLIFSQGSVSTSPNTYTLNYALRVANVGWTTATLFQRFNNNGSIFAGGAISMAITARAQTVDELISLVYQPSDSGAPTTLVSDVLDTGNYQFVSGTMNLPSTPANTDTSDVAYVDMQIVLPPTGTVDLTDFQVVGQSAPIPGFAPQIQITTVIPPYIQQSEERQIDHLFHYYRNSIILQPKSSLLTGWNFGLNPWQFRTTVGTNVATNQYTADQTIVIQQAYVASATGNNVAVGQGGFALNNSLGVVAVTATNQFAILQYIDPKTIRPYWLGTLSSLVKAQLVNGAGAVQFKMRLIYIAALPSTTSQTYPVASWTAGADPVFAAGVTAIAPRNDPTYSLSTTNTDYAFEGFQLPISSNTNMTLGILFYTVSNMDQATSQTVEINDISLVPNEFAIASNVKTYDEVLRDCQFYYAKTFPIATVPVTAGGKNGTLAYNAFEAGATGGSYLWRYPVVMRITPSVFTAYNPVSANTTWYNNTGSADSGASSFALASDGSVFVGNAQVIADNVGDAMLLNATADARLGI